MEFRGAPVCVGLGNFCGNGVLAHRKPLSCCWYCRPRHPTLSLRRGKVRKRNAGTHLPYMPRIASPAVGERPRQRRANPPPLQEVRGPMVRGQHPTLVIPIVCALIASRDSRILNPRIHTTDNLRHSGARIRDRIAAVRLVTVWSRHKASCEFVLRLARCKILFRAGTLLNSLPRVGINSAFSYIVGNKSNQLP